VGRIDPLMNDIDKLIQEIAELKRRVAASQIRPATIMDVKDGKVRLNLGPGSGKSGRGESTFKDDREAPWPSPWLKPSQHHGFVTENTPYKQGQNVFVFSANGDFSQAVVLPFTDSDSNPRAKDAADDKRTWRIRKPEEIKHVEDPHAPLPPERPKAEDDDEQDHINRDDYEGAYKRKGRAVHAHGMPEKNSGEPMVERILHKLGLATHLMHGADGAEEVLRQFKDAAGNIKSTLSHTAENVLHQVGDKVKQTINLDGLMHQATDAIKQTIGATGILDQVNAHKRNMTEAGTSWIQGFLKHDDVNIGKDHVHQLGRAFTGPPQGFGGAGGGSGGGGSGGGSGGGGGAITLDADNTAFAWGRIKGTDGTLIRSGNIASVTHDVGSGIYDVTLASESPHADADYLVFVSGPELHDVANIDHTHFRITTYSGVSTPGDASRINFLVLP
jgi:ElaB/YqjD/DUF883 family membrane-anchored ribosome-binding protein